jgi:hypothetical protein
MTRPMLVRAKDGTPLGYLTPPPLPEGHDHFLLPKERDRSQVEVDPLTVRFHEDDTVAFRFGRYRESFGRQPEECLLVERGDVTQVRGFVPLRK